LPHLARLFVSPAYPHPRAQASPGPGYRNTLLQLWTCAARQRE
jgi:hypothetical protein